MKVVFGGRFSVVSSSDMYFANGFMFRIYNMLLGMLYVLPYLMAECRDPIFHFSRTPDEKSVARCALLYTEGGFTALGEF